MSFSFYREMSKGTSGNDVKKWQDYLKTQGYDIDSTGEFDDVTRYYTKRYQQKNKLNTSGIVDADTIGKAGYTYNAAPSQYTMFNNTESGNTLLTNKNNALGALQNFEYSPYSKAQEYSDLLATYNNREPWSYNVNEDELYKQYVDLYTKQGQLAMQDSMAQAAALTGGYGNSYAQSVGQQNYQQYMNLLNQVGIDLADRDYQRYQQEGEDMLTQIGLHEKARANELAEQNNEYDRLQNEYNLANSEYNDAMKEWWIDKQYRDSLSSSGKIEPFTGSTYTDARAYLNKLGVDASGLLGKEAWRKKAEAGDAAASQYDDYEAYLYDYIQYLLNSEE